MKKLISFSILFVIGLLVVSGPALAIDLGLESAKNAAAGAGYDAAGTTDTTLSQNIGALIRGILTVSGVIFTCLVFYAGYLWMTARGDEAQVEKSKEIIRAGVIGLTISLAAFGITNLVMKLVTGDSTGGGAGQCRNPNPIECSALTGTSCSANSNCVLNGGACEEKCATNTDEPQCTNAGCVWVSE